jgi:NitT/TauT family transport system ATP-binding protein
MSQSVASRISVRSVSKRFGADAGDAHAVLALQDVSFDIFDREVLCLLGPSGCGKSTILNIVAGFDQPSNGVVSLNGVPVTGAGPDRAVVFQSPALFPWRTVAENISFAMQFRKDFDGSEIRRRIDEHIAAVGLKGFENHYPYQLSGGMRQRVSLARALIGSPAILLLDEPFGALDAQTRLAMQELLQSIWQNYQPAILFITHDIEEALFLADRVLVMSPRPGKIAAQFNVQIERPRSYQVLTSPEFMSLKKEILSMFHSLEFGSVTMTKVS